jgi:hypothetical protein
MGHFFANQKTSLFELAQAYSERPWRLALPSKSVSKQLGDAKVAF